MATELKASQKVTIREVSINFNNNRNFNLFSKNNYIFNRNFFRRKKETTNRNYKRQGR